MKDYTVQYTSDYVAGPQAWLSHGRLDRDELSCDLIGVVRFQAISDETAIAFAESERIIHAWQAAKVEWLCNRWVCDVCAEVAA